MAVRDPEERQVDGVGVIDLVQANTASDQVVGYSAKGGGFQVVTGTSVLGGQDPTVP